MEITLTTSLLIALITVAVNIGIGWGFLKMSISNLSDKFDTRVSQVDKVIDEMKEEYTKRFEERDEARKEESKIIRDELKNLHNRISEKDSEFMECMKGFRADMAENQKTIIKRMDAGHDSINEKIEHNNQEIADLRVETTKLDGKINSLAERLEVAPCKSSVKTAGSDKK